MDWDFIVKTLGAIGVGTAALAWLIKSLVTHLLAKDVEKTKTDLQTTHAIALEQLKAELNKTAYEFQTRFSHLHEKRAKIFAEIYKRIAKTKSAFVRLTSPVQFVGGPSEEERLENARKEAFELQQYFDQNRLYLSPTLAKKIEEFQEHLWKAWVDCTTPSMEEKREYWFSAWKKIETGIPPILTDIENEMRKFLGDS